MAKHALKNIPEDICHHAKAAAEGGASSLKQETIYRLRRLSDSEDTRAKALHARWVMEALASGPAKRLKTRDLDAAFQKGVNRARAPQ